jgi:formamidopyrimidine-DNA glycosylase
MPEGHAVHRLARQHRQQLAGRTLRVTSPQGRAQGTARRLDGGTLVDVEAHGKHLFYRFDDGPALHVHLGRFGRFLRDLDEPRPTSRLRLESEAGTLDLVGPAIATTLKPPEEEVLRARIGPDPLRGDDPEAMLALLDRRRIPVGAALLDQRLFAGVGNIFRTEALHALGIDPRRTASALSIPERRGLWQTLELMMRASLEAGSIVSAPHGGRWVYRRERCATCGGLVERYLNGGRHVYSCPACQR